MQVTAAIIMPERNDGRKDYTKKNPPNQSVEAMLFLQCISSVKK